MSAAQIDCSKLISTDFSFLDGITTMDPYTMALLVTEADRYHFNLLCFEDFLDRDRDGLREIARIGILFRATARCVSVLMNGSDGWLVNLLG